MVAAQSYRALNWWLSFHGAREMLAWSSDAPSLQTTSFASRVRVVWVDYLNYPSGKTSSSFRPWGTH